MKSCVVTFLCILTADGNVDEHEFTKEWHHRYHDPHAVAVHVFQHFDMDGDHDLTTIDLGRLFNHMDVDGNV